MTAPNSTRPQFFQPTTKIKMVEYKRYPKLEYKIQITLRRRERCLRLSSCVAALVVLPDRFESVFSKDAGEFSSLYVILALIHETEI